MADLLVVEELQACQRQVVSQAARCRSMLNRPIPTRAKKSKPDEAFQTESSTTEPVQEPQNSKDIPMKKILLISVPTEHISIVPPQKHAFKSSKPLNSSTEEIQVELECYPKHHVDYLGKNSIVEESLETSATEKRQVENKEVSPVENLRADLDTYRDIITMLVNDFRDMKNEFDELKEQSLSSKWRLFVS